MEGIYEELLKKGKIQPLAPQRPEVGRVHDPKYCRYHKIVGRPTNACDTLRNAIQDLPMAGPYIQRRRILARCEHYLPTLEL